jgi:polysaccharide biosynthesis/export protein
MRCSRSLIVFVATLSSVGVAAWQCCARSAPATQQSEGAQANADAVAFRPCQELVPGVPQPVCAVDCAEGGPCHELGWKAARIIPWQSFAQGEYVGHPRTAHVPEYRLRVDDILEFRYRLTRIETGRPYELNVGDELRIESFTDEKINRDVTIQPDGSVTLPLLGRVQASRRTPAQLRDDLEESFKKFVKIPAMTVTPVKINTRLEDLRAVVDSRAGAGGQLISARVTPDGTIALPGIGSAVPAQGLSLEELKQEIDQRYARVAQIDGIEVTPRLLDRAPRFVYVLGEVFVPGRFELTGPTTVMQSIAMAGSWKVGSNLKHVVVFRRGDDWRLMATKLDIHGALYGKRPCPADEIWLNDSDIVVVTKQPILQADEWIELVFTRGIYGVVPFQGMSVNFAKLSSI